jgi:hypothetical protein
LLAVGLREIRREQLAQALLDLTKVLSADVERNRAESQVLAQASGVFSTGESVEILAKMGEEDQEGPAKIFRLHAAEFLRVDMCHPLAQGQCSLDGSPHPPLS